MADDGDYAQDYARIHNEAALANRRRVTGEQLILEGAVCCKECFDPIDPRRLSAAPGAVRCIDCQIRFERLEAERRAGV